MQNMYFWQGFTRGFGCFLVTFAVNGVPDFQFGAGIHRGWVIFSKCVFGEIASAENVIWLMNLKAFWLCGNCKSATQKPFKPNAFHVLGVILRSGPQYPSWTICCIRIWGRKSWLFQKLCYLGVIRFLCNRERHQGNLVNVVLLLLFCSVSWK